MSQISWDSFDEEPEFVRIEDEAKDGTTTVDNGEAVEKVEQKPQERKEDQSAYDSFDESPEFVTVEEEEDDLGEEPVDNEIISKAADAQNSEESIAAQSENKVSYSYDSFDEDPVFEEGPPACLQVVDREMSPVEPTPRAPRTTSQRMELMDAVPLNSPPSSQRNDLQLHCSSDELDHVQDEGQAKLRPMEFERHRSWSQLTQRELDEYSFADGYSSMPETEMFSPSPARQGGGDVDPSSSKKKNKKSWTEWNGFGMSEGEEDEVEMFDMSDVPSTSSAPPPPLPWTDREGSTAGWSAPPAKFSTIAMRTIGLLPAEKRQIDIRYFARDSKGRRLPVPDYRRERLQAEANATNKKAEAILRKKMAERRAKGEKPKRVFPYRYANRGTYKRYPMKKRATKKTPVPAPPNPNAEEHSRTAARLLQEAALSLRAPMPEDDDFDFDKE